MSIGAEKYVAFTTYKKDGTAKVLPVWIADLDDGTLGFTTASQSWKAKRLANDDRVALQPCDQRGNIRAGTEQVTGTAVSDPARFDEVLAKVRAKYAMGYRIITVINRVADLFGRHQTSDTAIIITLSGSGEG